MEKKDKIIIGALIVVIIALIASLAFMFSGNNFSNDGGSAPDGMKMYDFNSEFKMAVPEDVRFLKTWNNSEDGVYGMGYNYFDRHNQISVNYADSPLITSELIDGMVKVANSSGNFTIVNEGDMIISHNIKNNGKMAQTSADSNFTESILVQKGHLLIVIDGNDMDLIKSMANSIEYCK